MIFFGVLLFAGLFSSFLFYLSHETGDSLGCALRISITSLVIAICGISFICIDLFTPHTFHRYTIELYYIDGSRETVTETSLHAPRFDNSYGRNDLLIGDKVFHGCYRFKLIEDSVYRATYNENYDLEKHHEQP